MLITVSDLKSFLPLHERQHLLYILDKSREINNSMVRNPHVNLRPQPIKLNKNELHLGGIQRSTAWGGREKNSTGPFGTARVVSAKLVI